MGGFWEWLWDSITDRFFLGLCLIVACLFTAFFLFIVSIILARGGYPIALFLWIPTLFLFLYGLYKADKGDC